MKSLDIKSIKPSDFELGDHFWDSPLKDSNLETLAQNIIIISEKLGDEWIPFTWEEYRSRCNCYVAYENMETLRMKGCLDFDGGKYSVNDKFIVTLKKFLKPEVV